MKSHFGVVLKRNTFEFQLFNKVSEWFLIIIFFYTTRITNKQIKKKKTSQGKYEKDYEIKVQLTPPILFAF
jgi:hypothetical protein